MASSIFSIIDNQGRRVADVDIEVVEDEWYYGRVVTDAIPEDLRRDLGWYDEVVSNQSLSYLDDAIRTVERHALTVRFPDHTCHKAYALHIGSTGETEFRIAPVPPPSSNCSGSSTILR